MLKSNLFKQLLFYFPSQIIPALINLILILVLTRSLRIEEYGEYTLLIALSSFFVTVFTNWLGQSILYYFPKYKQEMTLNKFYYCLNYIQKYFFLVMSCLAIISFFVGRYFEPLSIYYIVILIILVQSLYSVEIAIYRAEFNNKLYMMFQSLSALLKLLFVLAFDFFVGLTTELVLAAICFSFLFLLLIKIFNLIKFRDSKKIEKRYIKDFINEMLKYGLPVMGMGFCVSLVSVLDRFILGAFHNTYDLGLYSANNSIINAALSLIFLPITMAIHPILMKLSTKINNNDLSEKISQYTLVYIVIGAPLLLLIGYYKQEISKVLLGYEYVTGSIVILISMIGVFLWNLSVIGHKGFEIKRKTSDMLKYMVIATVIGLIISVPLTWKFSYIGTAIGGTIINFIYFLLIYFNSKNGVSWKFGFKKIIIIFCCTIIAFALTKFIYSPSIDLDDNNLQIIIEVFIFAIINLIMYVSILNLLIKLKILKINLR